MTPEPRSSGSAFLRLDRRNWRQSAGSRHLVVDRGTGALALGREGQHATSPHEPFGSFGGQTLVRGVAITPDGQVLLADPTGDRILYFRNPFGDAPRPAEAPDHWPFRELWTPLREPPHPYPEAALDEDGGAPPEGIDAYRLNVPTDIAYTPRGDIVIVDSGHARLLVFTWPELHVRAVVPIPGGEPRAVAFDSHGRAYVADAGAGRIHRFDSLWRADPTYGHPGVEGDTGLVAPDHVAVDSSDVVFVVDTGAQRVVRLDESGRPMTRTENAPLELFDAVFPPPFELIDGSLTYPQEKRPRCDRLVLRGVQVDRRGQLGGTSLPLLARRQRIALPRSGTYLSEPLDGEAAGFPWHRLALEAEVPESSRLVISTLTAEEPLEFDRAQESSAWSAPLVVMPSDIPEVLVQSSPGRYLWIRLDLLGDGERTPLIHRIDVHGPRRSSLHLLPPPYHEVEESARFLDRLLSYFDTVYAEIEASLADFPRQLDPHAVTGDFLEWLGSWFDWRFLAEWPEATRREMIAQSVRFFRLRGTVAGLRQIIQWHTGVPEPFPHVIEHFRLRDYAARRMVSSEDLASERLYLGGRPLALEAGAYAHRFTVVVPSSAVRDDEARAQLVRLIEAQKPAHTGFGLLTVEPGMRIGCQSSVGIDTWLSDYPREPLGRSTLGRTARLDSERTTGARVGVTFLSD